MSPLLRRGAVAAALSVLIVLSCATAALAAKGGGAAGRQTSGSTAWSLVREYVSNSPNPSAPTWCLNEDDWHQRTWSGSLSGTFTASERLCDSNVDYSGGMWWNAGGIGVQADLYVTGKLDALTITSPQGDVHRAELVGSSTSKGTTTDHYQVCFVPGYSATYNTGGAPLPGGTYEFSLSGTISKATYTIDAEMADATFQQNRCPASQQNLTY